MKNKFICLVLSLLVCNQVLSENSQLVDGYKDLKFGMSLKDIEKLNVCTLFIGQQGLYKYYGKLMNLYEEPAFKAPISSIGGLSQIAIGLGDYKSSVATEYGELLAKKYGLDSSYSDEDIDNFSNNKLKSLDTIYANGRVVMTIYHDGQGGMLLDILYNDSEYAKHYYAKAYPKKATVDDI